MRKQDPSSGLQSEASLKLDLYFQHYSSQRMHSSLENVLKQILSDIRVLGGPPPLPSAATSSTSSSLVAGTGLFNFTIFFFAIQFPIKFHNFFCLASSTTAAR